MQPAAYREQYELEDDHWWFRGRRDVIWALLRRAGVGNGVRILDAGCGTGRNLIEFRVLGEARGVDPSPEAVRFCRERGLDDVQLGGLEALPFPAGSFDLLLATDVIEHVADDRGAAAELRRVAAPGAFLLVTVPAYTWLWSRHDVQLHHFRRYTWPRLRAVLVAEGWTPIVRSYFNTLLLPAVAAARGAGNLRERRRATAPAADGGDLRLTPPAVNRLLHAPLRAEAAAIARGAVLPAGVSIGVVCRAG